MRIFSLIAGNSNITTHLRFKRGSPEDFASETQVSQLRVRLGGPPVGGMPDGVSNNAASSGAFRGGKINLVKLEAEV